MTLRVTVGDGSVHEFYNVPPKTYKVRGYGRQHALRQAPHLRGVHTPEGDGGEGQGAGPDFRVLDPIGKHRADDGCQRLPTGHHLLRPARLGSTMKTRMHRMSSDKLWIYTFVVIILFAAIVAFG